MALRVTMQKLQKRSGSGLVTIPKRFLERDGLLDDDGTPREEPVTVDRLDEGVYAVRVCDGDVPEIRDCSVVRRMAAEMMLQEDALGKEAAD